MTKMYRVGEIVHGDISSAILVSIGHTTGIWVDARNFNRIDDNYYIALEREFGGGMVGLMPLIVAQDIALNEKSSEKRFVDLFRYVRPFSSFVEIDPNKGVTLRIQLDYQERTIKFAYSVCNGDNFNKAEGRFKAQFAFDKDESTVTLPMPKAGIPETGVVNYIWENFIKTDMRNDILYRQFRKAGYK